VPPPGLIITVTTTLDFVDTAAVTAGIADRLASWGHRVLSPTSKEFDDVPVLGQHRLAAGNRVVALNTPSDWDQVRFEVTRDQWLADFDAVLIDGRNHDSVACYQVPDLVIMLCGATQDQVHEAASLVRGWAQRRDLLPLDRAQLMVVPVLTRGNTTAPIPFGTAGSMCRNWIDANVPAAEVLGTLDSIEPLAALVAHRCGRTDLLANDLRRYVETARREPAQAYAYDVVVVRDEHHRQVAIQLTRSLRAGGLRVPDTLVPGATTEIDPLLTRAVCVLVGPEPSDHLVSSARKLAGWQDGRGPAPLVVTALLPRARPSTLAEPMRGSEWVRLEPGIRQVQDTARQVAALLR
jgi:hypothetical protein